MPKMIRDKKPFYVHLSVELHFICFLFLKSMDVKGRSKKDKKTPSIRRRKKVSALVVERPKFIAKFSP